MTQTVEISGRAVVYLFYAVSLAVVPVVVYFVVVPVDGLTSVLVAVLLASLVIVAGADLWYWKSGELSEHLDTAAKRNVPYDITRDTSADPGKAAKAYWTKAVRRISGDEDD